MAVRRVLLPHDRQPQEWLPPNPDRGGPAVAFNPVATRPASGAPLTATPHGLGFADATDNVLPLGRHLAIQNASQVTGQFLLYAPTAPSGNFYTRIFGTRGAASGSGNRRGFEVYMDGGSLVDVGLQVFDSAGNRTGASSGIPAISGAMATGVLLQATFEVTRSGASTSLTCWLFSPAFGEGSVTVSVAALFGDDTPQANAVEVAGAIAATTTNADYKILGGVVRAGGSTAGDRAAWYAAPWSLFTSRELHFPVGSGVSAVTGDLSASAFVAASAQADQGGAYTVRGSAQADQGGAYTVRGSAQADQGGAYTVRGSAQADQGSGYTVAGAVAADLSASAFVAASAQADLGGAHTVAGAVTGDLSASAFVAVSAQADLGGAYTVRGSAQADLGGAYTVAASAQADLGGAYTVAGAATGDLSASASVAASATADLAGAYDIVAPGNVTADLSGTFTLRNSAQSDLTAELGVAGAVAADISASAFVAASAQADLGGAYTVAGAATGDLSASAFVAASALVDLSDTYTVAASAQADLGGGYAVYAGGGSGASVDEVWNGITIEAGLTPAAALRVILAALAGRTEGIGTDTERYMSRDGAKPRLTAVFDSAGNRNSVTVDGSP